MKQKFKLLVMKLSAFNCQSGHVEKIFSKAIPRFINQRTRKLYVSELFLKRTCATAFTRTREEKKSFQILQKTFLQSSHGNAKFGFDTNT